MENHMIDESILPKYEEWLYENEKSMGTIGRYRSCILKLLRFLKGRPVCKEEVVRWKEQLKESVSPATVNGALAAANSLFRYLGWEDCLVKFVKVKRNIFCTEDRELTKEEYRRLVLTAKDKGNERLSLLIQTVCATGIRISELDSITVEAARKKSAMIDCKGRVRQIFLPAGLCRMLLTYAKNKGIDKGMIFITRTGRKLDRSNIWREMKEIARIARVGLEKAFPHNLRHLFARAFYSQEKDLLRLADILGHSSISTTRIYTVESGENHIRQLEKMNLIVCDYNKITLLL